MHYFSGGTLSIYSDTTHKELNFYVGISLYTVKYDIIFC